jgi:hypothetical protein
MRQSPHPYRATDNTAIYKLLYTYIYTNSCIQTASYIHIYIYTNSCIQTAIYRHIYKQLYTNCYVQTYIQTAVYKLLYTDTYKQLYTNCCIQTYIQTAVYKLLYADRCIQTAVYKLLYTDMYTNSCIQTYIYKQLLRQLQSLSWSRNSQLFCHLSFARTIKLRESSSELSVCSILSHSHLVSHVLIFTFTISSTHVFKPPLPATHHTQLCISKLTIVLLGKLDFC